MTGALLWLLALAVGLWVRLRIAGAPNVVELRSGHRRAQAVQLHAVAHVVANATAASSAVPVPGVAAVRARAHEPGRPGVGVSSDRALVGGRDRLGHLPGHGAERSDGPNAPDDVEHAVVRGYLGARQDVSTWLCTCGELNCPQARELAAAQP